jgi:two-component system NtrC family sensor kinase
MSRELILLAVADEPAARRIEHDILIPAGYRVLPAIDLITFETAIHRASIDLILLAHPFDGRTAAEIIRLTHSSDPSIPIIVITGDSSLSCGWELFQSGAADVLIAAGETSELQDPLRASILTALQRRSELTDWARRQNRKITDNLKKRINSLETLQQIGRRVTSSLSLEEILTSVVDAAVELSGADEGAVLLLETPSGELRLRAARSNQEDYVNLIAAPITDPLAAEVLRTGRPVLVNTGAPHKVRTGFLVDNLIYVPLATRERVSGILSLDNRRSGKPFTDQHVLLATALADYAAIAVENAALYAWVQHERSELYTILSGLEEGVIVVDPDERTLLINPVARRLFEVGEREPVGRRLGDLIQHPRLLDLMSVGSRKQPIQTEITLDDGRVLLAQITPINGVGIAAAMQDITHLKEIDRIKSDFVNTVSHDLRSPLTAILGYVELLERVGPLNAQQREFIRRVQLNVNGITALINDLLELGRIEAGFDARREPVGIGPVIRYACDGLRSRVQEKGQTLSVDAVDGLPPVQGDAVRLRHLFANLVDNAVKYSPPGGRIRVSARADGGQMIVQVSDNGSGIPPADQPFIFDRFYRAANIAAETTGAGLGLAIVKSIVEAHAGRIWVESTVGQGSTFTVVLSLAENRD